MKHFVLLKFEDNFFNDEVFDFTTKSFAEMEANIEDVDKITVHRNCVVRDKNMDVMVEIDLKNEETLYSYLNHDLHQTFAKFMDEHVVNRVSFDYE